jgi:DNA mismatch repair ATPase MutS
MSLYLEETQDERSIKMPEVCATRAPRLVTKYSKMKKHYKGYLLLFRTCGGYYVFNNDAKKMRAIVNQSISTYWNCSVYCAASINGTSRETYLASDYFSYAAKLLTGAGVKIAVVDLKSLEKIVV